MIYSINKICYNNFLFFLIDPEFQRSFDWLFHNRAPWDLVMSHWDCTFNNHHLQWKTSKDTQLMYIFEQWPILCMPDNYKLIQSDFMNMKICNVEVNIKTWMDFFDKLVKKIHINKRNDTAAALSDSINDHAMKDGNIINICVFHINVTYKTIHKNCDVT